MPAPLIVPLTPTVDPRVAVSGVRPSAMPELFGWELEVGVGDVEAVVVVDGAVVAVLDTVPLVV